MEICLYLGPLGSTTIPVDDVREILDISPTYPSMIAGKHQLRGYAGKFSFLAYSQDAASRKVLATRETDYSGLAEVLESQQPIQNLDSFNILQHDDLILFAVADGVSSEPESKKASSSLTSKETLQRLARNIRNRYQLQKLPSTESIAQIARTEKAGPSIYRMQGLEAAQERKRIMETAENPRLGEMLDCVQRSLSSQFTKTEQFSGSTFAFLYAQQLPRQEGIFTYCGRIGDAAMFSKIKDNRAVRGWYLPPLKQGVLPTCVGQYGAEDHPHIISKDGSFLDVKAKIIRPGEKGSFMLATDDEYVSEFMTGVARTPLCHDEMTKLFVKHLHNRRITYGEKPDAHGNKVPDWLQIIPTNEEPRYVSIDDATALFVSIVP